VVYSPDGTMLASGSEDKTIKLWDVQSGKVTSVLNGHT
jgi:WD40 repeat protein